jgi:hypothetical protein
MLSLPFRPVYGDGTKSLAWFEYPLSCPDESTAVTT